jgi:pimeloyl-ACP methyl ester carboxylesterase
MISIQTSTPQPNTIVLIHGLWMTPLSWEHWIDRYERAGYNVLAPAWPGMEGTVAELRANTAPYARLEIPAILDHYTKIIEGLDSQPIIMGHSFGGAFTEILVDRGLGAAGVGIDPAAVKGVLSVPFSTIRSTFPVLGNPANAHKAVMLSPDQFHLCVYEYAVRRGVGPGLRPLRRTGTDGRPVRGRIRQLQPARGDARGFPQ